MISSMFFQFCFIFMTSNGFNISRKIFFLRITQTSKLPIYSFTPKNFWHNIEKKSLNRKSEQSYTIVSRITVLKSQYTNVIVYCVLIDMFFVRNQCVSAQWLGNLGFCGTLVLGRSCLWLRISYYLFEGSYII